MALSALSLAVDADGNGMSDVWESLHPAAAGLPGADLDGDGASNLEESQVWSTPTDRDSVFRLRDLSLSGSSLTFHWQTAPWLRYRVWRSESLVDWWAEAGALVGTGEDQEYDGLQDEKRFHVVQAAPSLNSDTDALTNLEEAQLGTDPLLWDSDGDRVADDVEFSNGTDPLSSTDSDGDGVPDDWERWCIGFDDGDAVTGLEDVSPTTDFDGDGVNDGDEYSLGTSPVVALRNIVFFLTEDQGPDLGCLGTVGLDTANLDSLGTQGMIFDRAFSLSAVCSPSKMALCTGTYPHQNSAYRNVTNYGTSFPLPSGVDPSNLGLGGVHEDLPTLIEVFRDRGWHTAVSSKTHVQPIRKFPYHQGFGNPGTPASATNVINSTVSAAGDRPFFLWFNISAPHLPFRSIPNANGVWNPTGGLLDDGGVTNVDPSAIAVPDSLPDVPGVRQDIADYYGAIEVIDSIYAAVRAALQAQGILDETLVVFSGDHGLGLHRFKQSIYGMHVPLLIDGPGVSGGRRTSAPVSHLDLYPTFLEFAGISQMPSLLGKSLWPVLAGADSIPGRATVLTACHEKYDARAVCDGRYYYVRNIRQVAGATLAAPGKALNADQFQGGSPWFNRSYDATVAASGTPQYELLRQLVEGDLAHEELYDLDADLWCTNNLVDDPALADRKAGLRAELSRWRMRSEDYNESPDELARRSERFTPLPGGGGGTGEGEGLSYGDDFDGKTGVLDADADWSTVVPGNGTNDFTFSGGAVDGPAGARAVTAFQGASLQAGQRFTVSVKAGFTSSVGVGCGVAFGIAQEGDGDQGWWQFLLTDGRSAPGGTDKDVRLFRLADNGTTVTQLLSVNNLTNYPNGFQVAPDEWFTVEVGGEEGSALVDLRILNPDGTVYYQQDAFDLGTPVPAGSAFGLTTWSSNISLFEDFALTLAGPGSTSFHFDSGSGDLGAHPDWSLEIAGNGGADFQFVADPFGGGGQGLAAPAGPQPPLAVHQVAALGQDQLFSASVEVGYATAGIFGGLVFGFTGTDDWFSLELGDGNTANAVVQDKLFRIRKRTGGVLSTVLEPAAGTLPLIQRGRYYRLVISGQAGQSLVNYSLVDTVTTLEVTVGSVDLGIPVPGGGKFGVTASSSSASRYDNLEITFQ